MAYAVSFSQRAELDLDLIFIAIDAENSEAALRWYLGLRDAVLGLANHPNRCPIAPESHYHRQLLYGRRSDVYRIIYEVAEEAKEVTIVHIRHGARKAFTPSDLN